MKHQRTLMLFLVVILIVTACGGNVSTGGMLKEDGDKTTAELKEKIHQSILKYSSGDQFSGIVFVAQEGKVIMNRTYGKANFKEDIDHEEVMLYQIGSLTKAMTAMIIMQLNSEGKINLEDSLGKFIPAFPHSSEITIHQLLAHSSGLPSQPFQHNIDINAYNPNNSNSSNAAQEIKLMFTPGSKHSYSNIGYTLLGFIIEMETGMTLEEAMDERIFKPLGMVSTGFYVEGLNEESLATGYLSKDEVVVEKSWWDINVGPRGGGGLYSTISDLYKWDQGLYTEKLIDKEYLLELFKLQIASGYQTGYGYGWFISGDGENVFHEHNGISAGFHTYLGRRPADQTTIIIFSNYQQAPIWEMARNIKYAL